MVIIVIINHHRHHHHHNDDDYVDDYYDDYYDDDIISFVIITNITMKYHSSTFFVHCKSRAIFVLRSNYSFLKDAENTRLAMTKFKQRKVVKKAEDQPKVDRKDVKKQINSSLLSKVST